MRIFYFLLAGFLTVLTAPVFAQCPPPGFPDAGNSCPQAPILCENLDGYCNQINNNNTPQSFPGCPGWQLNNDEWFAFFAGSTSITIQVVPSNCSQGPQMGLQAGIYAGCGPPWQPMALQCSCTQNPFTLSSNNFVIGQIYYFVLDGCAGNVCNYTINVLSGSTVGVAPNNPGAVTGPTPVCQGTSTAYTTPAVFAATVYTWTLTPASAGTITGNGTRNITVNWSANYSGPVELCVQASNLCYSNPETSCITIDVIPRPTATLSGGGLICANDPNPDPIEIPVVFTGDGPWVFVYTIGGVAQPPITTNDNPYIIMANQPGTYALQSVATEVGNCAGTVSGTAQVTQVTLNAQLVPTNDQCGVGTGSVTVNYNGGNAPYMFNWSNGENTQNLTNLTAGSYTLTLTDGNGCTVERTVEILDNQINITISANVQPNTTCIAGNGSITTSVAPQGSYTYEWSNGASTPSLTDLEPGTYTVTVTTGTTCTAVAEFTIDDQPNEPVVNGNAVPSTCDLDNGSINITVSGGVPAYTFQWSNGATTEDLSNIPAGGYGVTVTGSNGCTGTLDLNVDNNNPPINVTGNVISNTTCTGGNGSINTSVSPQGTYTYTWSTGATTPNINNLPPDTYTVTVSAGGSCTETVEFVVPDEPLEPNINANTTESTCELSNGSITLSVSGGVPGYTFLWSGGQTTQNLSNIPAGSYAVTVTGANGCSAVENIDLDNNNPPIDINGNVLSNTTCIGGNGSINTSISPQGNYTYTWSTGATTPNISNLPPGTYTITVNGGGACVETTEFEVPDEPNTPNINWNTVESTCELSNGSISLSVSGGVPGYTYLWSTGQTTQTLNNIPSGAYAVTVTGANGCSSTEFIFLDNNNPPIDVFGNVFDNRFCVGGNGSITLAVSPPNPNYTYTWSTGQTTPNISNLPSGLYEVTVNGGGACIEVASFFVADDPITPDLAFSQVDARCGLNNGSIDLTVFGVNAPYTYQWSTGQTTQDLNNIPTGFYAVTVTGSNGCTSEDAVFIGDEDIPISLDGFVNNKTSCVVNNGSIQLSYSPFNLAISWSNGSNQPNLNNLAPGTYTVTVSAGGTCTETMEFTVEDATELPNIFEEVTPATCGFSNGIITLDIFDGIPPYFYQWSNGGNTQTVTGLAAGNYAVTVTTSVGCSSVLFVTVPGELIDIEILGTVSDNVSCTNPNGFVDIDLFPTAPYSYAWSNNRFTQDIFDVPAGVYTVTVTLGIGCSAAATFEVFNDTNPPNLSTSTNPAICGQSNGSASVTASGGSAPYTYAWTGGGNAATISNRAPGTYTVTVTDFFGCSATASVTIVNSTIAVNITGTPVANTSCAAPNGAVNISASPAVPYTYTWSNGLTTQNIANVAPGTYTVTVSAGVGCSATASFAVANNTADPVLDPVVTASICGLNNGAIDLGVTNGTAPYTYAWSNMAATQNLSNILAGIYTVTVSDANGCTAISTSTVPNNASTFSLTGAATALTSCTVNNGAIDLTVTPPGAYTYEWSSGQTTQDISSLPAGTFTVSVTEQGDCTASATFVVANNQTFPTLNQSITPELCDLGDGAINLSVGGGAPPFSFNWGTGQTTEDLANIPAGDYAVTVTGTNGCSATATATVPANAINFSIAGVPTANTSCVTNNGAVNITLSPTDPGAGPGYSFVWSNMAGTEDVSGLAPGSYTVTVSAGGSCTATASYNVNNNAQPPSLSESVGAALCGQNSGFVNLTVSGGASPYTFQWSNMAVTEDINGLTSGTYTVTVTGANGCTTVRTFNVQENTVTPDISALPTANTSCVTNNGSINLSVLPTTLTYTYAWAGGQTTANLSGLAPGAYTVTVNGGGSCTNVATITVGNNIPAPQLSEAVSAALCGQSSGAIDLTASGGVSPYVFLWSNSAAIEDLLGVPSGTYTVTVTGANGCSASATYAVPEDTVIPDVTAAVTPVSSCVVSNGAIALSVTPTNLNYTYQWAGSQTTANLANLAVGSYTVTVNGGGACIATATFDVVSSTGTVVLSNLTPTPVLCFGQNTGAINLTVGGGAAPYTFNWSPGIPGNPQNPANLAAGTYAVTATDAAGCTATSTVTVNQPAAALQLSCSQANEVSFPGAGDGAAAINLTGGTAPYTVVWTPGGSQTNVPSGVFPIGSLNEGSYAVAVTDANGCPAACNFTINIIACETKIGIMQGNTLSLCGPGCLTANYNPIGEFLEPGDVLQFILHTGSGTQIVNEIARSTDPTFCFDAATMTYGTTYYISAAAGNNDGAGNVLLSHYCTVVAAGTPIVFRRKPVATASQPGPLNCAVKQVPIAGASDIPGSTFAWSTTGGQIVGNPNLASISAGAAGTYTLIVGANGCADTTVVQVQDISNQPQATIVANPSGILDCGITEILLTGGVEGSSDANTVWLYNGNSYATGTVLNINAPGTYSFVILDTLTLCRDSALIQIQENLNFPPLFAGTPATLNCINNSVTLTGGSSFPNVQFSWALVSGTDTTIVGSGTTLTVTQPGNYLFMGLDPASMCTNEISVNVLSDIVYPVADAGTPFSIYCFGETATLDGTASSGLPGLAYQWSTSNGTIAAGATTPTPTINRPGTYTLVVTNPSNGCTDTDTVVIAPDDPIATAAVKHPPCEGDRGSIVIDTVIGGQPPLRYTLNGGTPTTSNLFTNLNPGDYTIFIVDANGCSTEVDVTVNEPQIVEITVDAEVTIRLGDTYLIEAEVNLPTSALAQIQWTPSNGLACDTCLVTEVETFVSSIYRLTVVSKAGCRDNATVRVLVDRRPNVYIPNVFLPDSDGDNAIFRIFADQTVLRVKSFEVFSRWGERVHQYYNFVPDSPAHGWDGRFNGQPMNPGVFAYYAVIELVDGQEVLYEGDVTIVR